MEHQTGTEGMKSRVTLRLVDPGGSDVWEPDPAIDTEDVQTLDELAELFIGEQGVYRAGDRWEDEPEAENDDARSTVLEAVITGHLPVRGAVWVRAYAASVARAEGVPVVLVRVTPDRTSVELVGTSADAEPVGDIATAIRAAGCAAGHWLLHFDELDQAGLLRAGLIDRVTVLSGADEPAIVSAYRLIKSMGEQPVPLHGEPARVGVAIVGADPSNTTRATGRLVDATRQFLGLTLEVRPGVPRVQSASAALLGDSAQRYEPADVLSMIVDGPREALAARPATPQGSGPAPEPNRAARPADARNRPSAALLVEGLAPTGLPCSVSPSVELAADNTGGLHLVCWWSPEAPGELLKAGAWARLNRPLLAHVCADLRAAGEPTLHVVSTDPYVAADLRGTGTVVHLARPAAALRVEGWVCGRVD
ncbi:MAG: hypothetical protein H6810_05420 [Phycisphaeraceae bacterium]|nr:MAG: hypothetical protein H6810_05420 [Phycisphaeraceae bacterium]